MAAESSYDYLFKIIVIGDSNVGKTSFLVRFAEDVFYSHTQPTVLIEFKIRTIQVKGKNVKLQIYDTAGQDRLRTLTSAYFRGSHGVLFMYSTISQESFHNLEIWQRLVNEKCPDTVKMLIGTKSDMEEHRKVPQELAKSFVADHGMAFFETSAKSSQNVHAAFYELAEEILAQTAGTGEKPWAPMPGSTTFPKPTKRRRFRCII